MSDAPHGTGPTWRRDALPAVALFALAVAVRLVFLARQGTPPYDPWRHLALVRNIREGLGFTLFDGQPYLWYGPAWYYVCAVLPGWVRMEWVSSLLSALAAPLLYLLARRDGESGGTPAPLVAGLLAAASGPLVAYTCHYGPEAASLALLLGGMLACSAGRGSGSSFVGGLFFGGAVTLRLNFLFDVWLVLPWLRTRRAAASWVAGAALPLAATWWRNHAILSQHPWVFTWDGLATRSADFGILSTLVIQLQPGIAEALRRLHRQIIPWPEWLRTPGGDVAWGLLLFVLCSVAAILASRRLALGLAAASAMVYFLAFDRSLSSNFFRLYLVSFPPFFLATGLVAARLWRSRVRWTAIVPPAALLLSGAGLLVTPPAAPPLDAVTPPPGFLTSPAYLVNSGFYHPESLVYRFPGVRFAGLPLDATQLEQFLNDNPSYRLVLWHDFSVQDEIRDALSGSGRVRGVRAARNPYGRIYEELSLE